MTDRLKQALEQWHKAILEQMPPHKTFITTPEVSELMLAWQEEKKLKVSND
jgi:hypothetical protein